MSRPKGSKNKSKVQDKKDLDVLDYFVAANGFGAGERASIKIKIILKSLGRIYKSEGTTLEEALGKIRISGGAKAVAVLTVERDGVKKDKIINGRHAQQLFGNISNTAREVALKWAKQVFES